MRRGVTENVIIMLAILITLVVALVLLIKFGAFGNGIIGGEPWNPVP